MTSDAKSLTLQQGDTAATYRLVGVMDFSSVVSMVDSLRPALSSEAKVTVDLADIQRSNSAGLGLLLEWLKQARLLDCKLRFQNVPDNLLAIASICALDSIISQE